MDVPLTRRRIPEIFLWFRRFVAHICQVHSLENLTCSNWSLFWSFPGGEIVNEWFAIWTHTQVTVMSNNYYCWDKVSHSRIQTTMTNEKILVVLYSQIESCILSQVLTEFLGFVKLPKDLMLSSKFSWNFMFSLTFSQNILFSHFLTESLIFSRNLTLSLVFSLPQMFAEDFLWQPWISLAMAFIQRATMYTKRKGLL